MLVRVGVTDLTAASSYRRLVWGTGCSRLLGCWSADKWREARSDFDALIRPPLSLQAFSGHFQPHLGIFIAQVKRQLQVGQEVVGELRVHVQHLQDLVPLDGVQVAVAQRPHVGARLPRLGEEVDELAEDVVLA